MENQPPPVGGSPIDQQFSQQFGQPQQQLPNSVGVLVLGICSIVTCFCYGIVGLACGIIALVLAGKGATLYNANPGRYTISSYNNMKAGKVCAIIGVSLSAIALIYFIIWIVILGATVSTFPWGHMNRY